MERANDQEQSPVGKKSAVTVVDHLRHALNGAENENVEYHVHAALAMLVSDDDA